MADLDRTLLTAVKRRARLLEQATHDRDEAIRAAVQAGFSLRQVADAAGLSFQRIAQIARHARV